MAHIYTKYNVPEESCGFLDSIKNPKFLHDDLLGASATKIVHGSISRKFLGVADPKSVYIFAKTFPVRKLLTSDELYVIKKQKTKEFQEKRRQRYITGHKNNIFSLKYEILVYKHIISDILATNKSPNFVNYIGSIKCKIPKGNLMYEKEYKNIEHRTLITEMAGTSFTSNGIPKVKPLRDIIKKLSLPESMAVLFQLVWAIHVMGLYELNHNDLHSGNIMVLTLKEPVNLYFMTRSNQMFKIKTTHIPYIFDWDYSYASKIGINKKVEAYSKILGDMQNFNPYRDLNKVLSVFKTYRKTFSQDLKELIRIQVPKIPGQPVVLTSDQIDLLKTMMANSNIITSEDDYGFVLKMTNQQFTNLLTNDQLYDLFLDNSKFITSCVFEYSKGFPELYVMGDPNSVIDSRLQTPEQVIQGSIFKKFKVPNTTKIPDKRNIFTF